jgi:allantoicase
MLSQRPFKDAAEVRAASERIMDELGRDDWLEAFRAHPRIGESPSGEVGGATARQWSSEEQQGMDAATLEARDAMARANQAYEQRFGYIYIVCATGRSAEAMLELARQRLAHDPETELRVAAGEQRAITRLRLDRLLST